MHPAPSIIFLTTASGAGYGLLFLLALGAIWELIPAQPGLGIVGIGLALALVSSGLIASLFHLGRPERAWRALSQWRSSWLSREGAMALITYAPALLFAVVWIFFDQQSGMFTLFGVLAALGATLTVYCTSMIYATLKPIRQWHHPLVPWLYLAFALMSGGLLLHALLVWFSAPRTWSAIVAILATLLALGLRALHWRSIDEPPTAPNPGSATGLGHLGEVRLLEPPHTQSNYLLQEMGFKIGRKHARKLRRLFVLLGLSGVLLTLVALASGGTISGLLATLAAACGLIAVVIERWLFFAEATHTVMLYYGNKVA